jgi:hypothetical protein
MWGFIAALFYAILLISNPRRAVLSYLIWACFSNAMPIYRISFAKWVDELFWTLTFILLLLLFILRRNDIKRPVIIYGKWFIFLIIFIFLSMLFNSSSPNKALRFIWAYTPFFIIFLGQLQFGQQKDVSWFFSFLIILFLAQLVLNLGWFLNINPLPNQHLGTVDFAKGTFGGSNSVAYFGWYILFLLYAYIHIIKKNRNLLLTGLIVFISIIQIYLTYTVHAYYLAGVCFVGFLLLFKSKGMISSKTIIVGILSVVALVGIKTIQKAESNVYGTEIAAAGFEKEQLRYRYEKLVKGPKMMIYRDSFFGAQSDVPHYIFFGIGPGNFLSKIAMTISPYSAETMKYLGKIYLTQSGNVDLKGGSITTHPTTSYSAIMGDLGLVGFICYFGFIIHIVIRVIKLLHNDSYNNDIQKVLALGYVSAMLLFALIGLLTDFMYKDTFCSLLGFWGAIVLVPVKSKKIEAGV